MYNQIFCGIIHGKMTIRMAYEMVMPYHLHMPSYFLETFTEYPYVKEVAT